MRFIKILALVLPMFLVMNLTNPNNVTLAAKTVSFRPYNIPLSLELQKYTFDLCRKRGIDYELALAVMAIESGYRANAISGTSDYGIMQINQCNHNWLKSKLKITNFLDAKQNINAGTFMLNGIQKNYSNVHQILMIYNMGEAGAKRLWNKGIGSSAYSKKVVAKAIELKQVKNKKSK